MIVSFPGDWMVRWGRETIFRKELKNYYPPLLLETKDSTSLMSITGNYWFHKKTYISGINHQIFNIFPYKVEIDLRLKVNNSYVCVQISPNQVMILFFYGKLENNWNFIVYWKGKWVGLEKVKLDWKMTIRFLQLYSCVS